MLQREIGIVSDRSKLVADYSLIAADIAQRLSVRACNDNASANVPWAPKHSEAPTSPASHTRRVFLDRSCFSHDLCVDGGGDNADSGVGSLSYAT
ncbi:hypothetical protein EN978_31555 [Mesorhizobium sp. M7A.F.Ca.US.001.04.1.1]|nr:hypothetical protein EN979_32990 [Mesorhizobium sp. M7A.F.Ca.US.001.04.2.1]RUY35683.1 hypothetical protein EN978_31555 [Mesorhizobium sp. M7A.F.Ca.US.001.04.1.1]